MLICLIAVCGTRYKPLCAQWNRYKNVKNEQSTPEKKKTIFVCVPLWPRLTESSLDFPMYTNIIIIVLISLSVLYLSIIHGGLYVAIIRHGLYIVSIIILYITK